MQIVVMYFGRPAEFLLMTSERLVMAAQRTTLNQVLDSLRKRSDRWAYELDDSHLVCTVNRQPAKSTRAIHQGDEIGIFSRKSISEW